MEVPAPGPQQPLAQGRAHRPKGDGVQPRAVAARQPQLHMVAAHHIGKGHPHIGQAQQRFGIAGAERARQRDLRAPAPGWRPPARTPRPDPGRWPPPAPGPAPANCSCRNRRKPSSCAAISEKPAAMAWPPPASISLASRAARIMRADIDAGNGARRTAPHAAFEAGDKGRLGETLLQPAGDDADHAGMPALARHQQEGRIVLASRPWPWLLPESVFSIAWRSGCADRAARRTPPPCRASRAVSRSTPSDERPTRPPALMRGPKTKPR